MKSSSRWVCCHSDLSVSLSVNLSFLFGAGMIEYVGSGGKKASFDAMDDGQGGQQNKQHNSLNDRPFIMTKVPESVE